MEQPSITGSRPHVSFEVEKVIGISSDGHYQVQWAPAWVSKFQLVGCQHLIQEFLEQQTQEKTLQCQQTTQKTLQCQQTTQKTLQCQLDESLARQVDDTWMCESKLQTSDTDSIMLSDAPTSDDQIVVEGSQLDLGTTSIEDDCLKPAPAGLGLSMDAPPGRCLEQFPLMPLINNCCEANDATLVNVKTEEDVEAPEITESLSQLSTEFGLPFNIHVNFESIPASTCPSSEVEMEGDREGIKMSVKNDDLERESIDVPAYLPLCLKSSMLPNHVTNGGSSASSANTATEVHAEANGTCSKHNVRNNISAEKPDKGPIQGKQTASKNINSLSPSHLNTHSTVKRFKCSYCANSFKQKNHLERHIRTHTDDERPFSCTLCSHSSSSQSNLAQHLKTHRGDKQHRCKVCEKSFTRNSSLKRHERLHNGSKPYSCLFCDQRFARSDDMRSHSKIHEQ